LGITSTAWQESSATLTGEWGGVIAFGHGETLVSEPTPDSAWHAPVTVDVIFIVLVFLSKIPWRVMELSPFSPLRSIAESDVVPSRFTECIHAELVKSAMPVAWVPGVVILIVTPTGMRSGGWMEPTNAAEAAAVVLVPLHVPLSPMADAQAPVAEVT